MVLLALVLSVSAVAYAESGSVAVTGAGMTSINNVSTDSLKDRTLSIQTHFGIDIF